MVASTSIQSVLLHYHEIIDEALRQAVDTKNPVAPSHSSVSCEPFYGQMKYHLGWVDQRFLITEAHTGKLLRPTLLLLAYEVSQTWDLGQKTTSRTEHAYNSVRTALPAAAAIELVHNSTLIHDDIEDRDVERRHRPTVWSIWGVPHATNTGDGMLALARSTLWKVLDEGVAGEIAVRLSILLDRACLAIFEGQYLDMSFEQRLDISLSMYLDMIQRKTAVLMACAAEMGGHLGTHDTRIICNLHHFGLSLGMALQMHDDIMGIWATDTLGKVSTSDIYQRKKTLPIIYAMEHANEHDAHLLRSIYQPEAPMTPGQVEAIMIVLARTKSRTYCQSLLSLQCQKARESLSSVICSDSGISPRALNDLQTIIHFLESSADQ